MYVRKKTTNILVNMLNISKIMVVNKIIIYHLYCIHNIWYKKDSFCQMFECFKYIPKHFDLTRLSQDCILAMGLFVMSCTQITSVSTSACVRNNY